MKILNIELISIEETKLGFEHWVNVTYSVPILKNEYKVKLLLLLDFKVEDKELLDYLINLEVSGSSASFTGYAQNGKNIDNYSNFGKMLL
jgi:hypothetical protein